MNDHAWLGELKQGDEVLDLARMRIVTVKHLTPTQVVLASSAGYPAEFRVRRKTNVRVGEHYSQALRPADSEGKRMVRHHELKYWARNRAEREIQALPLEAVGQVRALIEQLKKDMKP